MKPTEPLNGSPLRRVRGSSSPESPAQGLPTVLMVEDDSEFAEDMTVILRGRATIIRVSGTAEAAAVIMKRPPDLLWIDLDLSPYFGFDRATEGLAFLRALRERIPIDFSILIVTADTGPVADSIPREFPMATVLPKPPEPSRLYASVSEILPRIRGG